MKALYAKPQIANSAKFYARSPQCNKPLKVDKVLIFHESKNQIEAIAKVLEKIEDLKTYNILLRSVRLLKLLLNTSLSELPMKNFLENPASQLKGRKMYSST